MPFNIRDWKKNVFMDILQSDYEQDFIGTLTQFINDVGDSRSLDYAIETIILNTPNSLQTPVEANCKSTHGEVV